jgi:ribosomal protein L37AE/L43A
MPTVSCPACSTSQVVEPGAAGYACTSCGTSWEFVTCQTCGSRFHSRPGSTGWTCPNCGTPHGTPAQTAPQAPSERGSRAAAPALAIKGDDLDAAPSEPLRGPQQPFDPQDPASAFPMPRRADRGGIPPWVFVAVGAVLVVVVVVVAIFLFTRGGDDAPQGATPTGSTEIKEKLCSDVRQLSVLRTDALGRAQDDLKADAAALKEAGDKATAKKVSKLVAAVGDVRTALGEQRDTTEAATAMAKAIAALDCSA